MQEIGRSMKTRVILAPGATPSGSNATAANAATSTATSTTNNSGQGQREGGHLNLTVGETLTFSSLDGHWVAPSQIGAKAGNSSGTFTFKVASITAEGASLTLVSGTFSANGTTYTATSGQLSLNRGCESGSGNGTASGGATFEIHMAGIHGNITSNAEVGAIRLDVTSGKSGYLVILGSQAGIGMDLEVD
jgi:hypothetical protein